MHRSLALAYLRHKHRLPTGVSLAACHFPRLARLAFVNHTLHDCINASAGDGLARGPVNNTRSLRIVYPVRVFLFRCVWHRFVEGLFAAYPVPVNKSVSSEIL